MLFRSLDVLELKPDFILVSAGFDAHGKDTVQHGLSNLTEFDFHWVTQNLVAISNTCCHGRIVSALEGGYNTRCGPMSPFA